MTVLYEDGRSKQGKPCIIMTGPLYFNRLCFCYLLLDPGQIYLGTKG